MKILALLLLLATPSFCQWRAVDISSANAIGAIEENFRRASLWSNRKLDRFSNDTLYGQPIFQNGIKFADGTIQYTAVASTESFLPLSGGTMTGQLTMNGSSIAFVNPGAITNPNYVQFNTAFTNGFNEGRVQWNPTYGTLEVGMPGGNVNLQIGQENLIRCYNDTGVTIPNGSVVYITSGTAYAPTIALADADGGGYTARVFGVATEDIPATASKMGYVTTFGLVHDVNTSAWTEGESLYLGTTPGQLTNTIPPYPAIPAYVATVIHKHASVGIIGVRPMRTLPQTVVSSITATEYWGDISSTTGRNINTKTLHNDSKDPTGFPYASLALSSLSLSGRVFTINGSNFPVYINGARVVMSTSQSTIPNTTQTSWLYYDTEVSTYPSVSASFPGFDKCLIATVYYSTRMVSGLLGDERHGSEISWKDHEYKHDTIGSRYASGMSGSFSAGVSTITSGEFYDEDLEHMIPQMSSYTALYKNGSSFFDFSVSTTANYQQLGQLYYNNGNALTALSVGSYAAYWVFATPFINYPYVVVVGNRADTTIAAARENNTLSSLSLTGFPTPELKPIYRVIYRQGSGSYTYQENADYRSVSELPGANYVPTQHSSLSGLSLTESAHPYDQPGGYAGYDWVASTLNAKPDYDEVSSVYPATATIQANYGISASTIVVSGSQFSVGGSTLVVANGRVGIGAESVVAPLEVNGTGNTLTINRYAASATGGPNLNIIHYRGTTISSNVIVANGDELGRVTFRGGTGSANAQGAYIVAGVDGEPGVTNDMPGRLAFNTTPDGSGTPAERMRIDSTGKVGINTTTPGSTLHVNGDATIANSLTVTSSVTATGGAMRLNQPNNTANTISFYNGAGLYENARIESINDINYNDSGYLKFLTARTSSAGLTEKMRIEPNGHTTIFNGLTASSVTATGKGQFGDTVGIFKTEGILLDSTLSGDSYGYHRISNAGGTARTLIGIEATTPATVYNGSLSNASFLVTAAATPLQFGTNATANMTILNGGNVGIGTTGPGYKLDVAGDINTSGAYKINGVAVSGLGNVVLASTQTFSGANTFQSSTTFNGSVYGSVNMVSASTHTISGTIDIGWETKYASGVTGSLTVSCSAGKTVLGGGCYADGTTNIRQSYPTSNTTWGCAFSATTNAGAWAICARIKPN